MSSRFGFVQVNDERERQQALDPRGSFIVQAPAGSGKTELLIQRYLKLLAVVEKPERILAMTFTRKAAAEMSERILLALRDETAVQQRAPHEQFTHELAATALAQDRKLGWNLLENPGRIKVQTIDSMCGSLVAQMPWLARQGALPNILEEAQPLYLRAARRTVMMVEQPGRHREWIEHLLAHLDNKTALASDLIASMLAKRDQWIALAVEVNDASRTGMETILERVIQEAYESVERMLPARDLIAIRAVFGEWDKALDGLLTQAGTIRKTAEKQMPELCHRLATTDGLLAELKFLRKLPPVKYSGEQWRTLRSLLEVLKLAAAQLRMVFQEAGTCDFVEMTLAAGRALGAAEDPTDLALKLDARIEHLLIDEFQDTSTGQFALTEKLIEGWEENDGRSIFVVGDPMQSIYRFRQAEVGLFLETAQRGIGQLQPQPLVLNANYRSAREIVDWVNRVFSEAFPARPDAPTGAVTYSASIATRGPEESAVQLHAFPEQDREWEARRVVEIVRESYGQNPGGTVAILVRARSHLPAIITALQNAGLSFRAVKIDELGERQSVLDLLSLTRAMLHLGDRAAWLAILRAPWCGLSLADLYTLAGKDHRALIYDLIHANLDALSEDGRKRLSKFQRTMDEAFEERGRVALRVWVERTWGALGGAACLQTSLANKDAADYFTLLESEQAGSDLKDFDGFAAQVEALKAQADPQADERLLVMTIHEAKGLQFDTVILPGLGRSSGRDPEELVLYHEGVIAPIRASGGDEDPVYRYLKAIEKRKNRNEVVRQLYVAATRPRRHLHLMGFVCAAGEPDTQSLLDVLWAGLLPEERQLFRDAAALVTPAPEPQRQHPSLRRLPLNWKARPARNPVRWAGGSVEMNEQREPTFEWVGDSLRHAGTVVHAILRRIGTNARYRPEAPAIATALAQLGVPAAELDITAQRVTKAVSRILASERGRWILEPHRNARSELAVAATLDGKIVRGTIDRTFIDAAGTRWIIDFKTSAHEGGGLVKFLDEQQRRYREQLDRYGKLFAKQGNPVRLGLYFPLLDEWREWQM